MKKLISILTAFIMTASLSGLLPASASAAKIKKPSKVTIKSVNAITKSAVKASWKKVKKAKGYQIKIAKNKKFKGTRTINIKRNTSKYTIRKLKSGTKYFVKVRAYTKVGKKKVYGKWSKTKSIKTKKSKVPSPIPETTEDDWEPSNQPNYSYTEPDDYYTDPEPEQPTQPTTLSKSQIEANKQKLSVLNEQLKAKYEKGNYLKLNNGENGKQIYSSRRWKDIEDQLKDNLDFINANLDSAGEWIYNQEAWDIRFKLNYCFINDKPLERESESDIYWGYTFDLDKYPELQEFFRSNPANITDDMTDIQKLEAIATYISKHGNVISWEERYGKGNTYAQDVPDEYDQFGMHTQAYMVLIKDGTGVCVDFSAACCFWAGYYDISCLMISSANMDHAWNRAILKDENGIEGWYELDPYAAGHFTIKVSKVSFDLQDNVMNEDDAEINTVPITLINK